MLNGSGAYSTLEPLVQKQKLQLKRAQAGNNTLSRLYYRYGSRENCEMSSPHAAHYASTSVDGPSIFSVLNQFPNVCFTLALLTDITYWQTSYLMWTEFSSWLLLVGISFGALALIVGIIAMFTSRAGGLTFGWPRLIGLFVVLMLAFLNNLIHARDGWTSVVPWGLTLSALTVLVILVSPWLGTSRVPAWPGRVRP